MLKEIANALELAGFAIPKWFGILMIVVAIVVGLYVFIKKSFLPWIKKILVIQSDIASIPKIREASIEADKKLEKQVAAVETNMTQKVNANNLKIQDVEKKVDSIENKLDLIVDTLSKLQAGLATNEVSQAAQAEGLKMMLCNELDKRYRRYLELGYIPDNEFDEYVHTFEAYHDKLGGNGSGKAKYDYIMEHLERKV